LKGRVRTSRLTQDGRAACVLDTESGQLRAFSDAAAVHLPELRCGRLVHVVVLRLRRRTTVGNWNWQLLACRGVDNIDAANLRTT
jgi:hypothetical protein